jgi:UDP-N-acetylglucosamine enolpyruvyl transferase
VLWALVSGENVIRESTCREEIVRLAKIARRFGAHVSVFRTKSHSKGRREG